MRSTVSVKPDVSAYFKRHGFYLFRGALDLQVLDVLQRDLVQPALGEASKYVCADAVVKWPMLAEYVTDPRCVGPVEQCIGEGAKFLQVADLQINHNVYGWHRDSASRKYDGVDWRQDKGPYTCVKAILYLESESFGLEVVPCSHLMPISPADIAGRESQSLRLEASSEDLPSFDFSLDSWHPVVLEVREGDMLVFDQRLFHRGHPLGRPLGEERARGQQLGVAKYTRNKATVCFCYGLDNFHSRRFHAYFRYHRADLDYGKTPETLDLKLRSAGCLLSTWNENFLLRDRLAATDLYHSAKLRAKKARPHKSRDADPGQQGLDASVTAEAARAPFAATPLACPSCARSDSLFVSRYPGRPDRFFTNLMVVACPSCGFSWLPNSPHGLRSYLEGENSRVAAKLLPPAQLYRDEQALLGVGIRRTRRHLRHLRAHCSSLAGTVVDVGCGVGLTLSRIPAQRRIAVEPASVFHPYLRSRGIDIASDLSDIPEQTAELVIMSHFLNTQPAADLPSVLSQVRRVLQPGGRLLVEVPNAPLLQLESSAKRHAASLCFFSLEALGNILGAAGFQPLLLGPEGRSKQARLPEPMYMPASPVQSPALIAVCAAS